MDTNTAPQSGTQTNSYVDAYEPPPQMNPGPGFGTPTDSPAPMQNQMPDPTSNPTPDQPPQAEADPQLPLQPEPQQTEVPAQSESIEDQNIFFMLGVTDGTQEQRDAFLDELQQVIWEDFLENDVKLLVTTEEMAEVQKMLDNRESRDLEKQEEIIVYLEKLIPDLEQIMLEKALELKVDMVRERVEGLRQFYSGQQEKLNRIDQADQLITENKWYSAAHLLNSLSLS